MYAKCYNTLTNKVVGWNYNTFVPEGCPLFLQLRGGRRRAAHLRADLCRVSDTEDGFKHFIYYVYGN